MQNQLLKKNKLAIIRDYDYIGIIDISAESPMLASISAETDKTYFMI